MSRSVRFFLMLALAGSSSLFSNCLPAIASDADGFVEESDDQPVEHTGDYYDEQIGSTPAAQPLDDQRAKGRSLDDDPAPEPQPLETPTEKFAERYPSGKI